jgi:hypothetical protein
LTAIDIKSEAVIHRDCNVGLYWGFSKGRDEVFAEGSRSDGSVPCRYLVCPDPLRCAKVEGCNTRDEIQRGEGKERVYNWIAVNGCRNCP